MINTFPGFHCSCFPNFSLGDRFCQIDGGEKSIHQSPRIIPYAIVGDYRYLDTKDLDAISLHSPTNWSAVESHQVAEATKCTPHSLPPSPFFSCTLYSPPVLQPTRTNLYTLQQSSRTRRSQIQSTVYVSLQPER